MPPTPNIGPRHRQQGSAKMTRESWQAARRLVAYVVRRHKWRLLVVAVCIVVSAVTTLASSLFTRTLIDQYIVPLMGQADPDFHPLALTLLRLGGVLAVGVGCAYLNSRLMIVVSQSTLRRLRSELFHHMQTLPISYFDTHAHGDIMSVYTNDVDTLRQMLGSSLTDLFSSSITILLTLVSMFALSWPLTLLTLALTSVMIFTTKRLSGLSARHFRSQQESLGRLNAYTEEMLGGQKVIKTYCHEQPAMDRFNQLNETLRSHANSALGVSNIVMPINGNISNLIYVCCAIAGSVLALNPQLAAVGGWLTVGTLVSFLTLTKNFTRPVSGLSNQVGSIVQSVAGALRVFALMDAEPEVDEGTVTLVSAQTAPDGTLYETSEATNTWAWKQTMPDGTSRLIAQRGEVDFQGVDFGYTDSKQVIFNLNLDTDAGQKIALVGGTGAGKTTITNLINRFYNISHGVIYYDHIDIKQIRLADLRHSLGMVLQETRLFSGSVMDNIRYGRFEATDEQCMEAARLVGADDFIRRLPQGYDTQISATGGSLSQGERQLIAIARAAAANPPALILDEATSSIDTHTESLVQKGMDSLMRGRSTFVIAHRLSTIRNADMIVVMEHGRIIEQGTHEQLLALRGKYHQLYTGLNGDGADA